MTDQSSLRIQSTAPSNSTNPIVEGKNSAGEWMTLQEAHDATGMSEPTLRRYIKRGSIKYRRQGRTVNSKLEVFVTPEMRDPSTDDRVSTDGLEEVLTGEPEFFDATPENEVIDQDDYSDQSTRETLNWMRDKLDDKDSKIETLTKELMAAQYRNGYLESQIQTTTEQVKLLTDREREQAKPDPSWWSKFSTWFMGSSK